MAEGAALIGEEALVDSMPCTVTLFASGRIEWRGKAAGCLSVDSDVLGFVAEGSELRLRTFVRKSGGTCCGDKEVVRERKDVVIRPFAAESLKIWCEKLREVIDSLGRPKRLLILVNPYGGKQSASKIFANEVEPLLIAADIKYHLQETQHQLHAKEISYALDLEQFDGIVCVSGDGVLVEVVNGLLQRKDWATAIKMPIGIVPAGSGNGMVKSLLDSVDEACVVSNAIFAVIRGRKCALDVATILQGDKSFFSVLMLTWGIVADIDIESEKYRWMGSARFDFYSIVRIMHPRRYQGRVSFVPAPGFEAYGDPVNGTEMAFQLGSFYRSQGENNSYVGPACSFDHKEWRTYEGLFILIWLHNVPWGSQTVMPAPDAKFSDGYLDLIVIRDCPRLTLLNIMTKLDNGGHVKSPHVLYIKVKAVYLEPGQRVERKNKGGIIDCDGEVLARGEGTYNFGHQDIMAYAPIYMTVEKGLATLFSPK